MLLVFQKKISLLKTEYSDFISNIGQGGMQKSVDTLVSGYSQKYTNKETSTLKRNVRYDVFQIENYQSKVYNKNMLKFMVTKNWRQHL